MNLWDNLPLSLRMLANGLQLVYYLENQPQQQ